VVGGEVGGESDETVGPDRGGAPDGLDAGADGGREDVTGAIAGTRAGVADNGAGVAFVGARVEAAGAFAGVFAVFGEDKGEEAGPVKDAIGDPAAAHWLIGGVLTLQAPGRAKA